MVFSVQSCALVGLEPHAVTCEVDLAPQLPALTLVGLPSSVTQESRERIRAAVVNSGFEWPARKITISLLPANLPKWGSHFELAMALGILGAAEGETVPEESPTCVRSIAVFALGELSLSGGVRSCGWTAALGAWLVQRAMENLASNSGPMLVVAHDNDIRQLDRVVPELRALCEFAPAQTLIQAYTAVREAMNRDERRVESDEDSANRQPLVGSRSAGGLSTLASNSLPPLERLARVRNEPLGVIAALAAIAGRHHCLLAGPHGMGKSMLIQAVCESLSALSEPERELRNSLVRSVGDNFVSGNTESQRPVVYLQTSATRAALEGSLLGSGQVLPGEFTRAHLGVLVADELLEFRRDAIEALRQPLDEGFVRLQRAKFRAALPGKFQFLATTNLCPCGFYGLRRRLCRCLLSRRHTYQAKLSGPLVDRFDLVLLIGAGAGGAGPPTDLKDMKIPGDLQPLVEELLDPAHWAERLNRVWSKGTHPLASVPSAEIWSEIGADLSERGKLKLALVSRTLATLLDQVRDARHVRLAMLLRQDLHALLRTGDRVLH